MVAMDKQPFEALKRKLREHWPPITQSRLARRLDIPESTMSRILSGQQKPPADFYVNVSALLGCDVSEIEPAEGVAA